MDFNLAIRENEYKINKISGLLAPVIIFGAIILYVLDYLGLFILDPYKVIAPMFIAIGIEFAVFLVTIVIKIEKPWVKYFILTCDTLLIVFCYAYLSMHFVVFLIYPTMKTVLYYDKRMSYIAVISSWVALLVAHVLSVSLSAVFDDPIVQSYLAALLYGFLPRMILIVGLDIIIFFLSRNTSGLFEETLEYANENKRLLHEARMTHIEVVKNLATMSENKSGENGQHIGRVYEFMRIFLTELGYNDNDVYDIALASMLHDIGKLGVDEKILSKPGRFTPEEYEIVKTHTTVGKNLLINSDSRVLQIAAVISEQHHERWDGTGYHGLKGEEIDYYSRIMSIIDVYDALTSKRSYKPAWSPEDAKAEIIRGAGTQFDPKLVKVFEKIYDKIDLICKTMHDNENITSNDENTDFITEDTKTLTERELKNRKACAVVAEISTNSENNNN